MKEFKNKTASELKKMLADKQEALRVFRFNMAGSKSRNVREGRMIRRDIARIETALNA